MKVLKTRNKMKLFRSLQVKKGVQILSKQWRPLRRGLRICPRPRDPVNQANQRRRMTQRAREMMNR
jgi:hypothetical protein